MKKINIVDKTGSVLAVTAVDNDFDNLSVHKWYFNSYGYVVRSIRINGAARQKALHREVLGEPQDRLVDHINGNKLDNRSCNLRACSRSENQQNRGLTKANTSGYKGVDFNQGRWRAVIGVNGKKITLGFFNIKENAAEAYKLAATKYHGEFAHY